MKKRMIFLSSLFLVYVLSALSYFVAKDMVILSILFLTPLLIFICSFQYSKRYGIDVLLSIGGGMLFFPLTIYPYNDSAIIYCVVYGVVSIIGQVTGYILTRSKR